MEIGPGLHVLPRVARHAWQDMSFEPEYDF
jgi:hypothetical protein